jgi:biopolymer transport protein ExbD
MSKGSMSTERMKARREERRVAGIDVTSFSDIAFLLIVFFILATTFEKVAGHMMEIPSGSTETSEVKQKQLTINVRDEQILYGENNRKLSVEELRFELAKERLAEKDEEMRMVILECSDNVRYELYYQVVMAISNAGGILALVDYEESK